MGVCVYKNKAVSYTIQQAFGVSWLAGQGIRTYIQPSAELVALNYHCLGTVNGSMTVNVSRCCFLTKNIRMSLHTYIHMARARRASPLAAARMMYVLHARRRRAFLAHREVRRCAAAASIQCYVGCVYQADSVALDVSRLEIGVPRSCEQPAAV